MNINASKLRGCEGVRDLGLGVLEECEICINNVCIHNEAPSLCSLNGGYHYARSCRSFQYEIFPKSRTQVKDDYKFITSVRDDETR